MSMHDLSQARCPVHDVALTGAFASCPIPECQWQIGQWNKMRGMSAEEITRMYGDWVRNAAND